MNRIITIIIAGTSFLVSGHVLALTRVHAPAPMPIAQATTATPVQVLAKKEGGNKEKKLKKERKLKKEKKDKKIKGDHENKGKHKGHDNNEHSNSGDGKLKGLDRADEAAGEHGHRDKARSRGKHGKD